MSEEQGATARGLQIASKGPATGSSTSIHPCSPVLIIAYHFMISPIKILLNNLYNIFFFIEKNIIFFIIY